MKLNLHEHSHSHNHNVTVKEYRAPTDDSVRLLREMEDVAKNQFVNSLNIENNSFNFRVSRDSSCFDETYHVAYELNRSRHLVKIEIPYSMKFETPNKRFEYFTQCLGVDIAKNITESAIRENGVNSVALLRIFE